MKEGKFKNYIWKGKQKIVPNYSLRGGYLASIDFIAVLYFPNLIYLQPILVPFMKLNICVIESV